MKLYKLYLAKSLLVFCFLIPAMWVLAGVIGIIVGAVGKFGSDGPPTWIFVIPLVGGFFLAYMHLRIPLDVVQQNGRVHLLSQMDGFHDFITTLKSLNPAVKMKRC
jgi:hypothetical protein